MNIKNKSQAIKLFSSASELARALKISRGAVWQWPEELTERQINEITGAAVRRGLIKPKSINSKSA